VIRVERNGEVRLRVINAGASTNFTIDLGNLQGTLVAVDGNPITPLAGRRFPVAIAQRADISCACRLMALRCRSWRSARAAACRLASSCSRPALRSPRSAPRTDTAGPQVGLEQELELRASAPLNAKPVDRSIPVDLTGTMMGYVWGMPINGMEGLQGRSTAARRVEIAFRNTTMMSHPMHLHGHVFQVVDVNGRPIAGAVRDTILVARGQR